MLILENKALNLHSSLKHSIHKLQIMLSETHTHTHAFMYTAMCSTTSGMEAQGRREMSSF